ncbi:glycosyltransferase, partial [Microgenomates group bacterium]|nr:glycosyltransferase [Microgenomates group bacterium]
MKILFLARYFYPHIGGVEKQVFELSRRLIKKNHQVTIVTLKHNPRLKNQETINRIKIIRIPYLKIKYFGLLYIWLWF